LSAGSNPRRTPTGSHASRYRVGPRRTSVE
jgi:hypothetical protein